MDDFVGSSSLDAAWVAFAAGDVGGCTSRLNRHLDVLAPQLCAPSSRLTDSWSSETAAVVDDAFLVGLLARKVGALACAARAQRAVLLTTWSVAEDAGAARWFQTAASCELALVELARNRGTFGLRRLRAFRQQLIDEELRGLLTDSDLAEEPAIEHLDDQLEYLENELRMRDRDAIRPTYVAGPEPPVDPSAPPSDPVPPSASRPRGAWPNPLQGVDPMTTLRDGLEQLSDLNHATWRHIYEGREDARAGRHDAALDAFDRAIQSAELVASTFLGSWGARRVLAVAIVGRSGALEALELEARSLDDLALASGILADLAASFPEVIELGTDEAWAAGVESWRRGAADVTDEVALERSQHAIALLERARNTAVREPDDLISMIGLLGLNRRHYLRTHAYRALLEDVLAQQRVASELATHYVEQSRDLWSEALEHVPGRLGTLLRRIAAMLDGRRVAPTSW